MVFRKDNGIERAVGQFGTRMVSRDVDKQSVNMTEAPQPIAKSAACLATDDAHAQLPVTESPQNRSNAAQFVVNVQSSDAGEDGWGDILQGVAALLWPIVVVALVLLFKSEIASLARRIRKGSAFGAEAEFGDQLDELSVEAEKAKTETSSLSSNNEQATLQGRSVSTLSGVLQVEELRKTVLLEASRSPRIGLMVLSAEVDRLARRLAFSTGQYQRPQLSHQFRVWAPQLPSHVSAAYKLFSDVRNKIVHGRRADESEILSAIDSGLTLYDALSAIPVPQFVVVHPSVDLWGDQEGTDLLDAKGVIIKVTASGGTSLEVYPTTRTGYTAGMQVTPEWNPARSWTSVWYKDPDTGEMKQPWKEALEFIGRDLDQI